MKILSVDKQILSMLRPAASTQLAWHQCTADYWFIYHFKNAHTLMYELDDNTHAKSSFWMANYFFSTVSEQCPIIDNNFKQRGLYNYHHGFITLINVEETEIPIRQWASEYITLYNAKHKTQYLTVYELQTIEQLFKETT